MQDVPARPRHARKAPDPVAGLRREVARLTELVRQLQTMALNALAKADAAKRAIAATDARWTEKPPARR